MARLVELGAGTDHDVYEVNGELVVRFGTNPDPTGRAASTRREAQLLREVAARSPLPTPVPELVMPDEAASSTASCPACRCWDFALAGGRTSTPP